MTEQLSEEKQRKVYEWFYPSLKGEKWWIALRQGDPVAVWDYNPDRDAYAGKVPLQDLYMPDGKPNYNFWMECVGRLEAEGTHIIYAFTYPDGYMWQVAMAGIGNKDPWFALSELLEGE